MLFTDKGLLSSWPFSTILQISKAAVPTKKGGVCQDFRSDKPFTVFIAPGLLGSFWLATGDCQPAFKPFGHYITTPSQTALEVAPHSLSLA